MRQTMVLRSGALGLYFAALVGRIVSVEPAADRVVVEAGDERQAVVTPLARGLVPGDEVRLSEDERGTWRISTRLPQPRREAVRPVKRLPRTNATAPNPSAPEPQNDRAPGDGPGNRIPATSGVPSRR